MKKISFSERYRLQQAVLELIKTMTRRVDKRLNDPRINHISEWGIDEKGKAYIALTYLDGSTEVIYPAYQIGEEVAVAQRYKDINLTFIPHQDAPDFKKMSRHCRQWGNAKAMAGWTNKMFVVADLMPHRIRITDIKVERLQDISDEDCIKEGIELEDWRNEYKWGFYTSFFLNSRTGGQGSKSVWCNTPQKAFAALIDRICGKGTWNRNPWMFVYEFELIK